MAKRTNADTTVPPISGSFEDIVRAMLKTPPPPAGDRSTRRKAKRKSPKVVRGKKR